MKKSPAKNIFISHGLAESGLAQELAEALSQQGFHVSEPSTRVLLGKNFALSLASALKGADRMVVILSPNSVKSPLLQNEISYALKRPRFKNNVVPVITGKVDSYPWILRQMKPIQFGSDLFVTASSLAKRFRTTKPRTKALIKAVA
ncbi:MAG: toll/interleukin-1 receptor domain-containing protein [Verrucomicrobiales bacterium]|nr:toll/interleukin-1 receptor domain-containing protein [Verrucomicrobiales bacterium]